MSTLLRTETDVRRVMEDQCPIPYGSPPLSIILEVQSPTTAVNVPPLSIILEVQSPTTAVNVPPGW